MMGNNMPLKVNGQRLWDSLIAMAEMGESRPALSAEDFAARALFADWCHQAGMSLDADAIGNLYARRAGRDKGASPVVMGSHLDTRPGGSRFDGSYGVLAALEVVRSLNDADITTSRPLEIAVWINQAGERFAPAMLGSATFCGDVPLLQALTTEDGRGTSVATALSGHGGDLPLERPFAAYFEAHIEQGPVLEQAGLPIGIVTGGQAICWLDVEVNGSTAHAGTTPMALRQDALLGASAMIGQLEKLAAEYQPHGLVTVGQLLITAAARNIIPGQVRFTVDLRHPQDVQISTMEQQTRQVLQQVAAQRGLDVSIRRHWSSIATPFDSGCIAAVRQAVAALAYPHQDMVSGAGHDAMNLARHCPSTMIFIPCRNSPAQHQAEYATLDDVRMGADVLLGAVLLQANN